MSTAIIAHPVSTSTATRPLVLKISPTLYRAESRSVTLGTHDVKLTEFGWQCDCRGFYWRFTCAHVRAVEEAEVSEAEIEADLSEIAEWLREQGDGEIAPFNPFYTDGTPKPYGPDDSHLAMVRKARAGWSWDD